MMDSALEKALVEKAKSDPQAFGSLFDAHYPEILRYVLRRTANVQAAQDITSEVFSKAFAGIGKFRWQGIPFSAWLYRIANNETADYYKHGKIQLISVDEVPESGMGSSPDAEDELITAELELKRHQQYLILHDNIVKLDNKYQEVIALRFFQDKQLSEISEILGKPEGTVKSLLHRGLAKLKLFME